MLLTLLAFLCAIVVLVAVHEWGHFAVARLCGVKVLTFSIGFGPRVLGWKSVRTGTQFQLGLLPLGGFVRMLDEREAPVAAEDLPYAFNRKPLKSRAAVVAAGPVANLLLAVLLYTGVYFLGITEPQAIVAGPPAGSIAHKAGFLGGEQIRRVGWDEQALEEVRSFEDFRWWLTRAALEGRQLQVEYQRAQGKQLHLAELTFDTLDVSHADANLFQSIGFVSPQRPARIGKIDPASAAAAAGLQTGDVVLQVNGVAVADAGQLRDWIRQSGSRSQPLLQHWVVQRNGKRLNLEVTPRQEREQGQTIGRVGAMIGTAPALQTVRYGFWNSLQKAVTKTWEISALTLRMMGNILTGAASVRNLSGPLTIADYAGKTVALGLEQFLLFLALVSISLGVLNLLPLPLLDGGHLLYYVWEAITGNAISESWQAKLQRVGFVLLLAMMSIAIFNDFARLLS
ncbi:MAG: RIP metalloprotease RseP [Rhodoferax sp.]|nr:RIP metalloprotease RseP [Rhodoferax sp.]